MVEVCSWVNSIMTSSCNRLLAFEVLQFGDEPKHLEGDGENRGNMAVFS